MRRSTYSAVAGANRTAPDNWQPTSNRLAIRHSRRLLQPKMGLADAVQPRHEAKDERSLHARRAKASY
jgi:hypothetical protein